MEDLVAQTQQEALKTDEEGGRGELKEHAEHQERVPARAPTCGGIQTPTSGKTGHGAHLYLPPKQPKEARALCAVAVTRGQTAGTEGQ